MSQLATSCTSCRSRKVRCSGTNPCTACLKRGDDCVFKQKLKPGLKKGTGRELQGRLAELESKLAAMEGESLSTDQISQITTHDYSAPAITPTQNPHDIIQRMTNDIIIQAHNSINLDSLQGLTILAWLSLRDAHPPNRWLHQMSLSRAINLAFKNCDNKSPFMQPTPLLSFDPTSHQSINLYWSAFIIDRLACFTTGWSFGVEDFHVPLPEHSYQNPQYGSLRPTAQLFLFNDATHALFSQPTNLSDLAEVIEWRRQHDALSYRLDTLLATQAQDVQDGQDITQSHPLLPLLQQATILRHHSHLAYPPHTTAHFAADACAQQRCERAAECITDIALTQTALITNSTHYNASLKGVTANPISVWCIWVAARNHLLAYTMAYTTTDADTGAGTRGREDVETPHNLHTPLTPRTSHKVPGLPLQFYQLVQSLRVLAPTSRLAHIYADVLDKITTSDEACSILAVPRTSFTVLRDASTSESHIDTPSHNHTPTPSHSLSSDLDVLFQDIFASFG
ncbi:hypothetical protein E3P86_03765 [Wallemia ichthyophaga]|uniref:Zn(2)-C6 fungal-type domain-containing protein n=1 Tax=Wallemia ichthyophaga TaxID=245174 RepID=A0A4T0IGX7_WALIC|nr:hypothetical protein E3P86_03765 [Wallemia ichthyophaga]